MRGGASLKDRDVADEDDRIRQWKELVLRLEAERRHRGDGGVPFDIELVRQLEKDRPAVRKRFQKWRRTWLWICRQFSEWLYRAVHGQARPKIDTDLQQLLVVQLHGTGKLSDREMRQIRVQGIVQRGSDGKPESVGPSRRNYRLATTSIAVLIWTLAPCIVYLLEDPFYLPTHLPVAVALGLSSGGCLRKIYDLYWGRMALARKLTYLWPAFRYVGKS